MRDMREKNWFWLDNALVDRKDLNIYEKMLYVCLARHVGSDGYAFPRLDTLCSELGIKDTRTIVKHTRSLEEKGLIVVVRLKGKSNRYYLNNVEKVDTSNVCTFNVGTSDVGSIEKVDTTDVTTLQGVPTSDVGTSTYIGCGSKKTNIKKETTKLDIQNKIEENPKETTEGSSSFFDISEKEKIRQIKLALQSHGLSIGTCKNIMELVYSKQIDLDRIKKVLTVAPAKNWSEGAIFSALKNNWAIEDVVKKAVSFELGEKEKNIIENTLKAKEEHDKSLELRKAYDIYFDSLTVEEQDYVLKKAQTLSQEKYGSSGLKSLIDTMARTETKYIVLEEMQINKKQVG